MALSGATILQVIPALDAGGAERTTLEVAEALHGAGATALVASAGGRLDAELAAVGGELVYFPRIASKNPANLIGNAQALAAVMRKRQVDLIHARSRAPAWCALWAAQRAGKPFVTTYHGIYNAKTSVKRLYNSVMARGDVVIANSEFTAAHVAHSYPEAATRIITIPRGVDVANFLQSAVTEPRKRDVIEQWKLKPGQTVILLPARLTGWKGHRDAVAAAARLAKHPEVRADWRMIFAGDAQGRDDYQAEISGLIRHNGLGDRISIVGHCSDMPAAFALADIVIAPSREPEAFGRVAAEAGAMGKPVVGSNIGGQREVIQDGVTGLLVAPGDAASLSLALVKLLSMGPERRAAMGAAASVRVRDKYTAAALQHATLAVYDKLIGRVT